MIRCYTMGKTTLEAHGAPLMPEQQAMGATSQIVSVLFSTALPPSQQSLLITFFYKPGVCAVSEGRDTKQFLASEIPGYGTFKKNRYENLIDIKVA